MRLDENSYFGGTLQAKTFVPSVGCVNDAAIVAGANIASEKLRHRHHALLAQANTAAADETRTTYVAQVAGTVKQFRAGSIVACTGDATVTVDLLKNGVSVLTAVITLDNANAAYVVEAGTIATTAYVANDVFTIVIDGTIGGGALATGVFADAVFDEAAT